MKRLLCTVLIFMLVFSLAGCTTAAKPEDTVKSYFEAAKLFDTAKANTFVNSKNVSSPSTSSSGDSEYDKYFLDYLKGNAKKVTYQIKGSEVKDTTAIVTIDCKYVDGSPLLKETMSQYFIKAIASAFSGSQPTQEETQKEIATIMSDKQKTTKETFVNKTVKINCVKISDKWYIDKVDDDINDVFFSNFISAGKEISKSFDNSNSSDKSPKNKLSEINNYMITDIWNKGFSEIASFISTGTGNTGESLDIDFTLEQLNDAMKKKVDYDSYITKLDDNQYSKVKSIWKKLSTETDTLYEAVKAKKPVANDTTAKFDTGKFAQYREAFSDAIDAIK